MSRRHGAFTSTQLVEMSTGLPEVVLKESDTWTNITFKGKGFAWVNHTENRAMIKAHRDERDALLATAPEVYELLEEGWRMTATRKVVKAFDESRGL